ncbi:MAG: serine/threonine protein kinase, partial [Myxococcales bacterium]
MLDQAYRVVRLLSEGGMGAVYEAVQLRLERRVAVKVLNSDMADNPEALARFRREVKVMSK